MSYNYKEHLRADIIDSLDLFEENSYDSVEEFATDLDERLFCEDSVTGNCSGSYTFNRVDARENVLSNLELLYETVREYCLTEEEVGKRFLSEDWEFFDVVIRCYLLSSVCAEVAEEYKEKFVA